eukprot:g1630.t1
MYFNDPQSAVLLSICTKKEIVPRPHLDRLLRYNLGGTSQNSKKTAEDANIAQRNNANIGLRNQRNHEASSKGGQKGGRLVPTRDPSKAQPSLVWIRAFESDLRRRPARRHGPTGSSATSGTWRRELADLARDPPVAPMSPIVPDKQPADGFANTTLQLLLPSYAGRDAQLNSFGSVFSATVHFGRDQGRANPRSPWSRNEPIAIFAPATGSGATAQLLLPYLPRKMMLALRNERTTAGTDAQPLKRRRLLELPSLTRTAPREPMSEHAKHATARLYYDKRATVLVGDL